MGPGDTLSYTLYTSLLFFPNFNVVCDLLLERPTATWNLFVLDIL